MLGSAQSFAACLAFACGVLFAVRVIMCAYMAEVYDVMIIKMTALWYKTVLTRLGCAGCTWFAL